MTEQEDNNMEEWDELKPDEQDEIVSKVKKSHDKNEYFEMKCGSGRTLHDLEVIEKDDGFVIGHHMKTGLEIITYRCDTIEEVAAVIYNLSIYN